MGKNTDAQNVIDVIISEQKGYPTLFDISDFT